MKFVWLIALILLFLFGASVAFSFVELAFIAALLFLTIGGAVKVVSGIVNGKLGSALCWAVPTVFFGWILSMCF